jgi:hypothetical protein
MMYLATYIVATLANEVDTSVTPIKNISVSNLKFEKMYSTNAAKPVLGFPKEYKETSEITMSAVVRAPIITRNSLTPFTLNKFCKIVMDCEGLNEGKIDANIAPIVPKKLSLMYKPFSSIFISCSGILDFLNNEITINEAPNKPENIAVSFSYDFKK